MTRLDCEVFALSAYGSYLLLEWIVAACHTQSVAAAVSSGYLLLKTEVKWIPQVHAFRGLFFEPCDIWQVD
jgi:hypothetical protein